jgi:hypothetical protein
MALCLVTAVGLLGAVGCNGDGSGARHVFDWADQNSDHPDTGERWAILMYVSRVGNHYQDIRQAKKDTAAQTDWDDGLLVVHEATHSKLLRGSYSSPKEASKHLEEVRGFTFREGGQPFSGAVVVKLPDTDYKPMYPQWTLSDAVGEYTVCVAVFYNYSRGGETFNRRKWAAEMYCKHLREDRNQEAYFHHGKSRSTVTIGTFPPGSVRKRKAGKRTITQIVDPRIDRVRQSHPDLIVNGWTEIITVPVAETRTVEKKTVPSYVVKIPDKEGEIDGDDRSGDGQPGQAPRDTGGTGRPERISPWP